MAPATSEPAEQPTEEPAATATAEVAAPAGGERTFVVDPGSSEISYEVDEEFLAGALGRLGIAAGLANTVGRTSEVEGELTLTFDGPAPQLVDGEFTVDISTLTSDQERRDNRIRDEWLESSRFPIATFRATGIQNAPETYAEGDEVAFQLAGDLTVREVTQPVVLDVTGTLSGDTITATATTQFLMSDFGVDPPSMANLLTVGDETVIRINLVAREQ
jgi:polyisoprenoid-binding protein YceI